MQIEFSVSQLHLILHGREGQAGDGAYVQRAFELSGEMWSIVKSISLPNLGKNVWVYGADHMVFAGVELADTTLNHPALVRKEILLKKYAAYTHIGDYRGIADVGKDVRSELKRMGHQILDPYIEIYGHWSAHVAELETTLLFHLAE